MVSVVLPFLPRIQEIVTAPWPWYVAGPVMVVVMFLLLYLGREFGISSNLRTLCAIGGAGRVAEFFRFDWKKQVWNLVFVAGVLIGGFIAANFMVGPDGNRAHISDSTVQDLMQIGINVEQGSVPMVPEFFSWTTLESWILLLSGGILVGFGSRYAGGCTSGHAISGMANLQLPSLIAVVGFFIGGLIVTWLVVPLVF